MPRESLCQSNSYQHRVLLPLFDYCCFTRYFYFDYVLKTCSRVIKTLNSKIFFIYSLKISFIDPSSKASLLKQYLLRLWRTLFIQTLISIHHFFLPTSLKKTTEFCIHLHKCNFCCVSELFLLEKEIFDDVKITKIFV